LQQGIKKGDRVGIYLPRCLDIAIALYGILKAGAVYVPLDPFSPASRTVALLNELEITVIITNKQQRRRLPDILAKESTLKTVIGHTGDGPVNCLPREAIDHAPASAPKIGAVLEDDLAYVMTTSGSTGRPKGIMHTHRSGLAYTKMMREAYNIQHTDVIGNHSSLHFDMSTLAYFAGPLTGATVVITTDAQVRMPVSMAAMIAAEQITIWYSVPLALQQMYLTKTMQALDLKALRLVIYGGEPIVLTYLRALMKLLPGVVFTNHYGPAEVNGCISFDVTEPPTDDHPIPIGFPGENTEMLVFDKNDQPVAENTPGLLLVRSASMMAGYWKNPELTKKSLYQRMRIPGLVETYYRTGDLVRKDGDGVFHFLGRKDRQVKVRGHRIELDEVENIANTAPFIQESAVFANKKGTEERKIILLVVLVPGQKQSDVDLTGHLRDHLPEYALPEHIEFTNALPRSSGGKIDRLQIERNYLEQT
jgi:amino acid adenylation domain-containing protein